MNQNGHGIFDTIVKGVTNILTSPKTKDIITEGAKAAAKSAGDKAGSKLVEKAFKKSTPIPGKTKEDLIKPKSKTSEKLLKEIYEKSILGNGIKRLR